MSRSDISDDATDDLYDISVSISIIMMASPTELQCMRSTNELNALSNGSISCGDAALDTISYLGSIKIKYPRN